MTEAINIIGASQFYMLKMANRGINEAAAKEMLKDRIQKYIRTPQKYPLDLKNLGDLMEAIGDDEAKRRVISMTNNREENIYHVAIRQNNFELVRLLNKQLPKESQDADSLLIKKKKCNRKRRFRGSLYGREAQCLTPLHHAVIKWRDEGDDGMYKALMDDKNITARQKLEMLSATDEKGRTVFGIAIDSDIEREKKEQMVKIVYEEQRKVRKTIDGELINIEAMNLVFFYPVLYQSILKLRSSINFN